MNRYFFAPGAFGSYMFYAMCAFPMMLFFALNGEFTDPDKMLSDRGLIYLPNIVVGFAVLCVFTFCITLVEILQGVRKNGVKPYIAMRSLFVFVITAPATFALLYLALENPSNPENTCIANFTSHYDALYFSYSSMTTLVQGNLAPIGFCRLLTCTEALMGYLLLSVLAGMWYSLMVPSDVPK